MITSFKFYTFSISDGQFLWRYSERKTDQSYPVKWGNFDCTCGNFDRPMKVTPSVNKVTMYDYVNE